MCSARARLKIYFFLLISFRYCLNFALVCSELWDSIVLFLSDKLLKLRELRTASDWVTAALSSKKTPSSRSPASPRTQQLGHMGSHFYCSMKAYMVKAAMTGMLCLSSSKPDLSGKFSQCKLLGKRILRRSLTLLISVENIHFTKLT